MSADVHSLRLNGLQRSFKSALSELIHRVSRIDAPSGIRHIRTAGRSRVSCASEIEARFEELLGSRQYAQFRGAIFVSAASRVKPPPFEKNGLGGPVRWVMKAYDEVQIDRRPISRELSDSSAKRSLWILNRRMPTLMSSWLSNTAATADLIRS